MGIIRPTLMYSPPWRIHMTTTIKQSASTLYRRIQFSRCTIYSSITTRTFTPRTFADT
ncbi:MULTISPECIES: hypothetical protein [unclassified Brenneria]|uniref:hypothetical protein n=1 Tax=unclassified Brenneria TaxID=2634434 RepID=UPI0029C1E3F3|nr:MULTISPECIES: hypothetical protein [unclassified Brenneria]MDX5631094.1 hypothetical protein [Brenneria sp. L3-3Z]MDX5698167.1 hypothetical protein [Brenneria sp. L4-2C]